MKYIIFYWVGNLSNITGYVHGEEITKEQVFELIEKQEVNVMIMNHENGNVTVGIDKLGMRFQQR